MSKKFPRPLRGAVRLGGCELANASRLAERDPRLGWLRSMQQAVWWENATRVRVGRAWEGLEGLGCREEGREGGGAGPLGRACLEVGMVLGSHWTRLYAVYGAWGSTGLRTSTGLHHVRHCESVKTPGQRTPSRHAQDDAGVAAACTPGSPTLVTTPTLFVLRDRHANYAHEMEVRQSAGVGVRGGSAGWECGVAVRGGSSGAPCRAGSLHVCPDAAPFLLGLVLLVSPSRIHRHWP